MLVIKILRSAIMLFYHQPSTVGPHFILVSSILIGWPFDWKK
jgi:hypothetical protein